MFGSTPVMVERLREKPKLIQIYDIIREQFEPDINEAMDQEGIMHIYYAYGIMYYAYHEVRAKNGGMAKYQGFITPLHV